MAKKSRRALSEAEREERRAAERKLLTDAVAALKSSEGWARWLRVRKAFHAYSMTNQLLIAWQCPQAERVAGFRAWLRLGYCVRKGEKALRIFAPVPPSRKQLEEWQAAGAVAAERPRMRFKLAAVFDRSQVEPLPAPAEPVDLDPVPWLDVEGDELSHVLAADGPLQALASELAVRFTLRDAEGPGGARGYFRPGDREVVVFTMGSGNGQVATAVHELAHALVHLDREDGDPSLDYASEELVVESVSYCVLAGLGIDAGASSVPYVAAWSERAPIETIEAHAKLVDRLAGRIEAAIEATAPGDDGLSRDQVS